MDPNKNLEEQLELATGILPDVNDEYDDNVIRLAELVIALNDWVVNGGALPDAWKRKHMTVIE